MGPSAEGKCGTPHDKDFQDGDSRTVETMLQDGKLVSTQARSTPGHRGPHSLPSLEEQAAEREWTRDCRVALGPHLNPTAPESGFGMNLRWEHLNMKLPLQQHGLCFLRNNLGRKEKEESNFG